MNRRTMLKSAGSLAAGAAVGRIAVGEEEAGKQASRKTTLSFDQIDFQKAGAFDVEKGKDAVLALCEHHGYPVFPGMRDRLWVSDYGAGDFARIGLAACLFVNHVEDRYMMLDIFLLPNQMLPEHWHVDGEGNPAKREGWLVRWGLSHIVGIGEPNLSKEIRIPQCHCGGKVSVEHDTIATPGTFVPLAEVGTRHWQYGGPQGAIVTEVANVHTNSAVRHSDPAMNKYFLDMVRGSASEGK